MRVETHKWAAISLQSIKESGFQKGKSHAQTKNGKKFGKIDINNPTFHLSAVNNLTFGLFYNNLTFFIHLPTTYHITNNR